LVYHARGNLNAATRLLTQAVTATDSRQPEFLYHLAVVYADSGNKALAVSTAQKALALKRDFPNQADTRKLLQTLSHK